jgi:hypothetical protein
MVEALLLLVPVCMEVARACSEGQRMAGQRVCTWPCARHWRLHPLVLAGQCFHASSSRGSAHAKRVSTCAVTNWQVVCGPLRGGCRVTARLEAPRRSSVMRWHITAHPACKRGAGGAATSKTALTWARSRGLGRCAGGDRERVHGCADVAVRQGKKSLSKFGVACAGALSLTRLGMGA